MLLPFFRKAVLLLSRCERHLRLARRQRHWRGNLYSAPRVYGRERALAVSEFWSRENLLVPVVVIVVVLVVVDFEDIAASILRPGNLLSLPGTRRHSHYVPVQSGIGGKGRTAISGAVEVSFLIPPREEILRVRREIYYRSQGVATLSLELFVPRREFTPDEENKGRFSRLYWPDYRIITRNYAQRLLLLCSCNPGRK